MVAKIHVARKAKSTGYAGSSRSPELDLAATGSRGLGSKLSEGSANAGANRFDLRESTEERVRQMIMERASRSTFFSGSLFAEPAWDMLLDLYCAHLAQQRACVTSVCAASSVPISTAIRWLRALESHGLVSRSQDPLDSRRFFVSLTPEGIEGMKGYLSAVVGTSDGQDVR
jgi:DNA-binding MarR family transcriptional regulator